MNHGLALLLTLGDPNGLGPELVCRLHLQGQLARTGRALVLIGPEPALSWHCRALDLPVFWQLVDADTDLRQLEPGIYLLDIFPDWRPSMGRAEVQGGLAAGRSLETACSLLAGKQAAGIVTCPLSKAMLHAAGYDFPGHTEFLAVKSGVGRDEVCMLLAGDRLRVGLATTHPPLARVPSLLNQPRLLHCLHLMWDFVQAVHQDTPAPLGVCGLNPHAGEDGLIGKEEMDIIAPAVHQAQRQGVPASGPWPADSLFYRAYQGEFSAVLAMYHDQGLAPLKVVHFQEAVNVTLGLPFVRTSVDHGTAYELVGTGAASIHSLHRALDMAEQLLLGMRSGGLPG